MKKILRIIGLFAGLLALIAAFLVWRYTPKTISEKRALIIGLIKGACDVSTRPVRPLVVKALEHIDSLHVLHGIAIDFGIGCGDETRYLLEQGYQVIAIDQNIGRTSYVKSEQKFQRYQAKLRTITAKFEDLNWTDIPQVDLFVALYSLTGNQVKDLPRVWKNIVDHITSGGFFVGEVTSSQKKEVLSFLKDFDIVFFEEKPLKTEEENKAPSAPPRTMYTIIARKK